MHTKVYPCYLTSKICLFIRIHESDMSCNALLRCFSTFCRPCAFHVQEHRTESRAKRFGINCALTELQHPRCRITAKLHNHNPILHSYHLLHSYNMLRSFVHQFCAAGVRLKTTGSIVNLTYGVFAQRLFMKGTFPS